MDDTLIDLDSPPQLARALGLAKTATGIQGLDEITGGGLPKGRPTLVCGGPGSGKTLLGLTFLVNGAVRFDEPGVLMTFEENAPSEHAFDHHLVKPVDPDHLVELLGADAKVAAWRMR